MKANSIHEEFGIENENENEHELRCSTDLCCDCDCDCCSGIAIAIAIARLCSLDIITSFSSLPIYENCILTIAHCNRPANVVSNPLNILFIQISFFFILFSKTFPSICSTSIHIECVTFVFCCCCCCCAVPCILSMPFYA